MEGVDLYQLELVAERDLFLDLGGVILLEDRLELLLDELDHIGPFLALELI